MYELPYCLLEDGRVKTVDPIDGLCKQVSVPAMRRGIECDDSRGCAGSGVVIDEIMTDFQLDNKAIDTESNTKTEFANNGFHGNFGWARFS